jgi:hypothetical protein
MELQFSLESWNSGKYTDMEEKRMRKFALLLIVLVWLLAACAGSASQPLEQEQPVTGTQGTPAVAETIEATAVEASTGSATEMTEAPASAETAAPQAGSDLSGVVTYSLVPEESSVIYEVSETFIREGNVLNVAIGQTQG